MTSRLLSVACGLLTLCLCPQTGVAQNLQHPDSALQQVNGPVAPAGTSAATPTSLSGGGSDLAGLSAVDKYPAPKTLTLVTYQTLFWTDNAFLTNENNKTGAFGFNSRLLAVYVPYSTYAWTPSISFEQQFVRYDHTSILDFDAQTVRLASKYDLTEKKDWSWTAAYSLQRLYTDRASLGEYYKQSLLENEIDYIHAICDRKDLFFLGSYNIGWRATDPDIYNRVDNSLLASVVYMPLQEVSLQAYARPAIYSYYNNNEINSATGALHPQGRTDYNASVGLISTYSPIKEVTLNANFNWTGNYSNLGDREYRTISPALTVSGAVGF